jgi:hypothetical protein
MTMVLAITQVENARTKLEIVIVCLPAALHASFKCTMHIAFASYLKCFDARTDSVCTSQNSTRREASMVLGVPRSI